MNRRIVFSLVSAISFVSLSAAAQKTEPQAGVNCKDMTARPNVIYAAGSTALIPFLGTLAPLLASQATPYTIVYQSQGSCTGVDAIYNADANKRQLVDTVGNYAVFYKTDGTSQECWLDVNGNGKPGASNPTPSYPSVDIGVSDVFASSCNATAPAGVTIADYSGPIQPMTFVVPGASSQTAISADAAYLAFGLGGGSGTMMSAPWTDPTLFFVRNAASGTQQMLARAVGVPADKWWGINRGGSGAVRDGLLAIDPALAEKAIGIVSVDIADQYRQNLRVLALKSKGQSCAYLPDSTINSKDKINVRDGHYPVWGPVHLFARTTNGLPDSAAQAFVGLFAQTKLDTSILTAISSKGLVPQCAMKVTRSTELGDMSPYAPPASCACFFEKTTNGTSSCKSCAAPGDCTDAGAPACNFGFCEPR